MASFSEYAAWGGALRIMQELNRTIGAGPALTDEERMALHINGRVQEYLYNRAERGHEVFISEEKSAGKSTRQFDPKEEAR